MNRGSDACQLTGIPELHAEAFQEVADATRWVIASLRAREIRDRTDPRKLCLQGLSQQGEVLQLGPVAGFVLFAVVPGKPQAFGLESIEDFRQFVSEQVRGRYAPVFLPGWMKQLVFHPSKDVASATRHAIQHGAMLMELKQRFKNKSA